MSFEIFCRTKPGGRGRMAAHIRIGKKGTTIQLNSEAVAAFNGCESVALLNDAETGRFAIRANLSSDPPNARYLLSRAKGQGLISSTAFIHEFGLSGIYPVIVGDNRLEWGEVEARKAGGTR